MIRRKVGESSNSVKNGFRDGAYGLPSLPRTTPFGSCFGVTSSVLVLLLVSPSSLGGDEKVNVLAFVCDIRIYRRKHV